MAIEMACGVYCPLSPRDPQHLLDHWLTKSKFNNKTVLINIRSTWINTDIISDANVDRLSSITVTSSNVAYIILTSASTGIPKSIRIRHQDFIHFTHSFMHISALHKKDNVIQLAASTFDSHVYEVLAPLVSGATVIMLHPDADATLETTFYLVNEISYINTVPIGTSFPNYKCLIIDNFSQSVTASQEGELFVGCVGIFAGYLGHDD
ncbi:unnamed protein product [Adineta steineri]|nr:unnamed protein product [Adineta steineri]